MWGWLPFFNSIWQSFVVLLKVNAVLLFALPAMLSPISLLESLIFCPNHLTLQFWEHLAIEAKRKFLFFMSGATHQTIQMFLLRIKRIALSSPRPAFYGWHLYQMHLKTDGWHPKQWPCAFQDKVFSCKHISHTSHDEVVFKDTHLGMMAIITTRI